MGCDIHMYVEYTNAEMSAHEQKQGRRFWGNFGGRINPGRNYSLFGLIAGVRDWTVKPIIEPRGLPNDLAYYASADSKLYISAENPDAEGNASPENAKRWVEGGYASYINNSEGKPTWVTHPDWHSHTWLTTDEFAACLEAYKEEWKNSEWGKDPGVEYRALLAAMRELEDGGKRIVRVVIWFDN